MDYAALILMIVAAFVFFLAAIQQPINTAWGFLAMALAFICQFTTITDHLANL